MWGETEAQKEKRIADVRSALASTARLSEADKTALLSLNFTEFPRVITAHPGHHSSAKLESLTVANAQFALSCSDLLTFLQDFHRLSDAPDFHAPDNREHFDALVRHVRKELFTFCTLSHSVQDHCRRVQEIWSSPDFRTEIAAHFGGDGLHEFVIALRTTLRHIRVFDAEWSLRWNRDGEKSSHFTLNKEHLLNDHHDWKRGAAWLNRAPNNIDVKSLVTDYRNRHTSFYSWYLKWTEENLPPEVAEYRDLKHQQRINILRAQWNFLLSQFLSRGVEPMQHLHKYMTSEQVAHTALLSAKSRELVDFVINCVDIDNACTSELREMAYKLFDVPDATWVPPKPLAISGSLSVVPQSTKLIV